MTDRPKRVFVNYGHDNEVRGLIDPHGYQLRN
jgi:hypothetical protein